MEPFISAVPFQSFFYYLYCGELYLYDVSIESWWTCCTRVLFMWVAGGTERKNWPRSTRSCLQVGIDALGATKTIVDRGLLIVWPRHFNTPVGYYCRLGLSNTSVLFYLPVIGNLWKLEPCFVLSIINCWLSIHPSFFYCNSSEYRSTVSKNLILAACFFLKIFYEFFLIYFNVLYVVR